MVHVPLDAKDVLDIGCANGLFGQMLKKRQECVVTGIDQDTELINTARARLDNVISGDIEEIIDRGSLGRFDCILCGDVLEHLENPWKVISGLRRHLKKGGLFIASVPNMANWAIVYEMLRGRWDYVPFTILSGTHIRFFTRESLRECFEDAGYEIEKIYFQSFGIAPSGIAEQYIAQEPVIDDAEYSRLMPRYFIFRMRTERHSEAAERGRAHFFFLTHEGKSPKFCLQKELKL
jgi:2-polyprenyl-3-methyl-5-hydroxy-6-metoxy-1,4-benzoquinol methylase